MPNMAAVAEAIKVQTMESIFFKLWPKYVSETISPRLKLKNNLIFYKMIAELACERLRPLCMVVFSVDH